MKKIMIALAAVAIAGAANAEVWYAVRSDEATGEGTLYNGKGTSTALSNWSVYLLETPEAGNDEWYTFVGGVVSSFQAGSFSESNVKGHSSYAATLTTGANGRFDTAQAFEYGNDDRERYFLAVAFNDGAMYVSDYIAGPGCDIKDMAMDTPMDVHFIDSDVTYGGGYEEAVGWYTVPEPTSDLLMLIGMAGLALRRKRG